MQKSERDQVLNFITKLASKLPPEAQGIFTEEQVHGVVSKTLENFKDKIPDLKAEEVRSTGEQYEFFPKTDSVEAEQGRNENDGKGEIMKKNVVDFLTERPNFLGRSEDTQKRLQVVLPLVWDQLQAAAPRLDREPIFVALAEAKIKAKNSDLNNDIAAVRLLHKYLTGADADRRDAEKRAKGSDQTAGIVRRLLAADISREALNSGKIKDDQGGREDEGEDQPDLRARALKYVKRSLKKSKLGKGVSLSTNVMNELLEQVQHDADPKYTMDELRQDLQKLGALEGGGSRPDRRPARKKKARKAKKVKAEPKPRQPKQKKTGGERSGKQTGDIGQAIANIEALNEEDEARMAKIQARINERLEARTALQEAQQLAIRFRK